MKKLTRPGALLTALVIVMLLAGCGGQSGVTTILINNDVAENTLKGESWRHFQEALESKLGDRVDIEIFDSGSLYSQDTQLQALQQNNVQFIAPVPGVITGQFPEMGVLGLPYLFKSPEMIDAAINDPTIGGELLAGVEEQGITVESVWLNGWRMVQTRDRSIERLEDMEGLAIRVPPGDNYVQAFEELGASPTTINWSEVPTSLQQGVIDAAEPTPNANLSDKIYEVAPHITATDHVLDLYVIATNKEWFDGLPSEVQEAIRESLEETAEWNWERTQQDNEVALQTMQEEGATFITLDDSELARWQEVTEPVIEHYETVVGSDVINELRQLAEQYDWQRS